MNEKQEPVKNEGGKDIYYMMDMPKQFIEADEDERIRLVKKFANSSNDQYFKEEDIKKLTESL